jgi:hypothetical protein
VPWRRFEVFHQGHVYVCCMGWLPLSVGNIHTESLEGIWNSGLAQEIRRSILDGSFRYCSKIQCPHIAARDLPQRGASSPTKLARPLAADPTEGVSTQATLPSGCRTLRRCFGWVMTGAAIWHAHSVVETSSWRMTMSNRKWTRSSHLSSCRPLRMSIPCI